MQGFKSPEDGVDCPETAENSIYTDDYQTEDAFVQIPASNEFVEEETQEISSIEPDIPAPEKSASRPFPAIQKLDSFSSKRETPPAPRQKKKAWGFAARRLEARMRRAGIEAGEMFSPVFRTVFSILKKFSREIAVVAAGTAVLTGCLLILGFAGLRA